MKNMWLWIVVVLALAAVYYFSMREQDTSVMMEDDSAMMEEDATMSESSVVLSEQSDSGENGTVTLTEEEGQVTVVISLTGAPETAQPAHIHTGSCPTPGGVVYPLTNVVNGMSETVIDVTMAELESQLPLAVNVHKSAAETNVYVACGDLSF